MGDLLSGPKVKTPKVDFSPKALPTADDEAIQDRKKKQLAEQAARGGRDSTIMTSMPTGGTLGAS